MEVTNLDFGEDSDGSPTKQSLQSISDSESDTVTDTATETDIENTEY